MNEGDILNRADKVAFMGLEIDATTFERMTGFTDISKSANPKEYSRQYVDETVERNDVTGYASELAYAFDQMVGNKVHQLIADVTDDEVVGAKEPIVTVDFSQKSGSGYVARKRIYSIVPDSDGDSTDAYTYGGSFKSVEKPIKGVATSTDNWKTCTFTEDTSSSTTSSTSSSK